MMCEMKNLFSDEKKYYIRIDKRFSGEVPNTFYPKMEFVYNEITGLWNPEFEIFDSVYRASKYLKEENLYDENKTDVTEISGKDLKDFIEKLNNFYGVDFRIKYHFSKESILWSLEFVKVLPELYKIRRHHTFIKNGGFALIQGIIMVGIFIAIKILNSFV